MSVLERESAERVIEDCRAIAMFSEEPGKITRTFLSPPMHDVHRFLRSRMEDLGMDATVDAIGNLRGLYTGASPEHRRLLIGSHIDTVPDAGAFDGVLGVALALELVRRLRGERLDFDIEVIAFSEEEGVRFGTPFLGSRALIGDLDETTINRTDAVGISVAQAVRDFGLDPGLMQHAIVSDKASAYLEFHIEQGPMLDSLGESKSVRASLGVVEVIVGQSRLDVVFTGKAGHAGTTSMALRKDALAGAAEWMIALETLAQSTTGLVATVGCIEARPGAANVVPGQVALSLDVRHREDAVRRKAVNRLLTEVDAIAARRGLRTQSSAPMEQSATKMHSNLTVLLEDAVCATRSAAHRMGSGAGHDAMVMASRLPSAMLFLPSPGGVSHHPDETVRVKDVEAAADAGLYFLKHLDHRLFK